MELSIFKFRTGYKSYQIKKSTYPQRNADFTLNGKENFSEKREH